MTDFDKSILLLLSNQPQINPSFGTAFVLARDAEFTYLVTCAHVVKQINGPELAPSSLMISELNIQPEIITSDVPNTDDIDMVLLRVPALFDKPILGTIALGIPDTYISINGYSQFEKDTRSKRELKGKLGKSIKLNAGGVEFAAWDIQIQDDKLSVLSGGYSGSPIYNGNKQIIGIMSHMRTGETGHAVCISNLQRLYPKIADIIPEFKKLSENSRLSQIRTRLLLERASEIPSVLMLLRKQLSQIEKNGIDEDSEFILQVCEQFVKNEMPATAFIAFCQSLEPSIQKPHQPVYPVLASRLNDGLVNICIGSELPALCDTGFPSTQAIYEALAAETDFAQTTNCLADVCEYAELHPNFLRKFVLDRVNRFANPATHLNIRLYSLLANLQKPFLVIATGFDSLLIDHLNDRRCRFVTIIPNYSADEKYRYRLGNYPDHNFIDCSNEDLSSRNFFDNGCSIIYYPRGLHTKPDSLLISERDYFYANQLLNKKFPDYIKNKLDDLTRHSWFLGFHPENWETRFLVDVLRHQRQHNRNKPLVIQENANQFSRLFWNDCELFTEVNINNFVQGLENVL